MGNGAELIAKVDLGGKIRGGNKPPSTVARSLFKSKLKLNWFLLTKKMDPNRKQVAAAVAEKMVLVYHLCFNI